MTLPKTEQIYHPDAPLDSLELPAGARAMIGAQLDAARSVEACADRIAAAARAMAAAIRAGGRLVYAGAGSSGLMAVADGMELGGTFDLPPERVRLLMAGGIPRDARMPGDAEDDDSSLADALADIGPNDCLIAVSASGSTPFALTAVERARGAGATIVAIANNHPAPLFDAADHAIFLDTPPEAVSGSTRLGAGTAQKIALNTLSTLMGVELGHVFRGRMVNLHADNDKLRRRARRIVEDIARVDADTAARALDDAGGRIKVACLLAAGANSVHAASAALAASDGRIGTALRQLGLPTT